MDIAELRKLIEAKTQARAQSEINQRRVESELRKPIAPPADFPDDLRREDGSLDGNRLSVAESEWGAATAIAAIHAGGSALRGEVSLTEEALPLLKQLARNRARLETNGTQQLERVLMSQVEVLNQLFLKLITTGALQYGSEYGQRLIELALSAQNQCRRTISTLNELKNPKRVQFVKQQMNQLNQVNQLLLEAQNNAEMDTRGAGTPATSDRPLEAVEALQRPEIDARESDRVS